MPDTNDPVASDAIGFLLSVLRNQLRRRRRAHAQLAPGVYGVVPHNVMRSMSPECRALRVALLRSHARMLTLCRAWDEEHTGCISLQDFRRTLPALGLHSVQQAVAV